MNQCEYCGGLEGHTAVCVMKTQVKLLKSLKWFMAMVEQGVLVRDIRRDGEADWILRMADLATNLNLARLAILEAEGVGYAAYSLGKRLAQGGVEYKQVMGSPELDLHIKTIVHPDRVSSDLTAEQAHAREQEDVCPSCGARTFDGICSAKCGG